jgi:hypothetical protein
VHTEGVGVVVTVIRNARLPSQMLPLRTYPGPEVDEPGVVAEIHERNCHLLFFDLTEPKAARANFGHPRRSFSSILAPSMFMIFSGSV